MEQNVLSQLPVIEALARAILALQDPHGWRTWRELCLALPAFGRHSLNDHVQVQAMIALAPRRKRRFRYALLYDLSKDLMFRYHDLNPEPKHMWTNGTYFWYDAIQGEIFH